MKAKRKNKLMIIGVILTIVMGGVLTYQLAYSKYRVTKSIDLATGTIKNTSSDFQMAVKISEDGENYSDISTVPASGYTLNTSKSTCKVLDTVDSSVTVEYIDGKVNFLGATQKGTKCYLYFDAKPITVDDIIASVNAKTSTPTFSNIATSDEGVYQTTDGMYDNGTTYYWRGKVENNYVKFAGFCWRIIRINGDKTIRLIYDGTTCHANGTGTTESLIQPINGTTRYAYNPTYNASYYVGWTYSSSQRPSSTNNDGNVGTASNAKTQLQTWYNANLASYEGKIAEGKYCNDRDTASGGSTGWVSTGTTFNYAGYKRLYTNKTPTFNCSNAGDVYTLKVGLITADEVAFAGGVYGSSNANSSYYLYNGKDYWTMSPYYWYSGYAYVFYVNSNGSLSRNYVHGANGLRPVINLRSDTTFASGGTGTQNNPYVVND